jgi:hypothetical protein
VRKGGSGVKPVGVSDEENASDVAESAANVNVETTAPQPSQRPDAETSLLPQRGQLINLR